MMNEEKGPPSGFFAWLSHRVRQPLNGVIETIEHLFALPMTPAQEHSLKAIRQSTQDLVMMINDILDLTRLSEGNFRLFEGRFDLRGAITNVADLDLLKKESRGRDVDFSCSIHPEVPAPVLGDAGRLRQALANMGRVSMAGATAGEIMIDATVQAETNERVTIRFSVSDDSGRLPKSLLDAVNEKPVDDWFLTENARTPEVLRMALTRMLAELMGGAFGVEAGGETGLTYWFTADLAKTASLEAGEPENDNHLQGTRVLFLFDNPENGEKIGGWLGEWGCDFETAPKAGEVLGMLRSAANSPSPFRLLLISTELHGQEAEDLGRQIRKDEALSGTALVLLSSVGRRGDAARLGEIGFSVYLTPPSGRGFFPAALPRWRNGRPWRRPPLHGKSSPVTPSGKTGNEPSPSLWPMKTQWRRPSCCGFLKSTATAPRPRPTDGRSLN